MDERRSLSDPTTSCSAGTRRSPRLRCVIRCPRCINGANLPRPAANHLWTGSDRPDRPVLSIADEVIEYVGPLAALHCLTVTQIHRRRTLVFARLLDVVRGARLATCRR
jgi:hypothetical protein